MRQKDEEREKKSLENQREQMALKENDMRVTKEEKNYITASSSRLVSQRNNLPFFLCCLHVFRIYSSSYHFRKFTITPA